MCLLHIKYIKFKNIVKHIISFIILNTKFSLSLFYNNPVKFDEFNDIVDLYSETPACFSARLTAQGARPICQDDGTYAPIQCHKETGYCWCVTPQGRPLPDTSVKSKTPRCLRFNSKSPASTRSGQTRHSPRKQRRQYSNNRHRNTCDRMEKSKFNENLIENFKIEYRRINISADGK